MTCCARGRRELIERGAGVSQLMRLRVAMKGMSRELVVVGNTLAKLESEVAPAKKSKDRRLSFVRVANDVVAAADAARARIEHDAHARGIDLSKADLAVAGKRRTWRSDVELFEGTLALLPRDAAALAAAERAQDATVRATDRAKTDPLLVRFQAAQRDVRLIAAHASHHARHRTWAKQGFTDHDPFFLWAMKRAGFTWGGEFPHPDLHHFEIRAGLNWKADW